VVGTQLQPDLDYQEMLFSCLVVFRLKADQAEEDFLGVPRFRFIVLRFDIKFPAQSPRGDRARLMEAFRGEGLFQRDAASRREKRDW
tara:strand:+ start:1693 stop:1953 length:261 start_codon:yes stop_codon:yes gene_type:complete